MKMYQEKEGGINLKTRGFEVCKGYENKGINLPIRSTKNSVAYDLEAAEDTIIPSIWKVVFENAKKFISGNTNYENIVPTKVYTGIKSYFKEDEVMIIANRSSGPSKLGLVMANSIGIFECDYYNNPSNDGNIIFQFYNFFPNDLKILKGDRIGQAYFQNFLIADNDNATGIRQGGIGSTGK
ncbi:MAG: dUTP diphosphatase [Clostridia bacterium]